MRPRRTVEDWRRAVYKSTVTDAVRVYLLRLADHMDADRTVCVPRRQLARELNRHEQRIAERTTAAIKAGLLDVVSPGYKGHTAVYQGLFPEPARGSKRTDLQYSKEPLDRYAIAPDCVPDGEYASSYQPPELSPRGDVPNEKRQRGQREQSRATGVRFVVDEIPNERNEERTA